MSEIAANNSNALLVAAVAPKSPAARAGVEPGDLLRAINGHSILDILDYRFHAASARLLLTLERQGAVVQLNLHKQMEQDAGLEFEQDLADKIHTCKNKCVFCFIHQQPKKMRKSLYLMDDDFRLSFMHGNYVTLTNLTEAEWNRILEQRLSPLYVSVHATNPALRAILLGRREESPVLPQLQELAENRISTHAQIVLCPDLNDGEELSRTLRELAELHPAATGMRTGVESVAIVPVGLTRFRERLPALQHVEREYARRVIRQVEQHAKEFRRSLGTRFAWLGDEWYHLAEKNYPGKTHYEEFPQLEDGIGTMRLFLEDLRQLKKRLPASVPVPLQATLITAELPAAAVRQMAGEFNKIEGVHLNVCVVKNHFFGGDIHIAGLLTASDILKQLENFTDCRETVYLPAICLKDNTVFLDDTTLEEACRQSGRDIRITGNRPSDLAAAMGLIHTPLQSRPSTNRWMMEEQNFSSLIMNRAD